MRVDKIINFLSFCLDLSIHFLIKQWFERQKEKVN